MTNSKQKLIDTIPTTVRVQLEMAAGELKQMRDALEQGKKLDHMVAGGGRYEGEICQKYGGLAAMLKLQQDARQVIDKWGKFVAEKGIELDFAALIEELELPSHSSLRLTEQGLAYAHDLEA